MNGSLPAAVQATVAPLLYLVAAVAFFLGLKAVAKVRKAARSGHYLGAGVLAACLGALVEVGTLRPSLAVLGVAVLGLAAGVLFGQRLGAGTPAPARLALVPALAGAATAVTALAGWTGFADDAAATVALAAAVALGALAALLGGAVAARGSISVAATAAAALSAVLAGWATALVGFAVENAILLIAGGVGGTAALTFGRIVARSSGRGLAAVLTAPGAADQAGYVNVRSCGTDEAAMVLESAGTVLFVPGFGMPAAQAQHAVKEVGAELERRGARVVYAVHPAAGCLPGHMNIALDEANVPHEKLVDLAAAQDLVRAADAVVVVGANDTVNPSAAFDTHSPLYGLGALDLTAARSVFVVKRSLRPGAGGVKNPLFERPNTMMMFGDGKKVMQALVAELKGSGAH